MNAAQFLTAESLRIPGVAHGFFTRLGGVSQGVYASLNGGVGSRDSPEAVTANRARIAAELGAAPERLAVPFQIHSPHAVAITELWPESARPRCDALVTATPGLALGVTGADCGMILFADQRARHRSGACGLERRADGGGRSDRDGDGAAWRQAQRHHRRARTLHRPRFL